MGILLNKGKNYIINGAMDFWQRGTSFATVANGTYTVDRFQYGKVGTAVHTISRDTDVPTLAQAGVSFPFSLRLNLTTAQASIAAGDYFEIYHKIEGSVITPLYGKTMTLSFWVKANLVGKYYVAFRNGSSNRSLVRSYDILQTDTWEKKTITITHDTTGTWEFGTSTGLLVSWTIASGSTFAAPSENTWFGANYNDGVLQVNGVQSGATNFRIAGVQLEEGVSASNFERAGGLPPGELRLCQRYYEVAEAGKRFEAGTISGVQDWVPGYFNVDKRVSPILSTVSVSVAGVSVTKPYSTSLRHFNLGYSGGALSFPYIGATVAGDAEL
jgi:hypothetical protein